MNKFFKNSRFRLKTKVLLAKLKCFLGFHFYYANITIKGKTYIDGACTWCDKIKKEIKSYD